MKFCNREVRNNLVMAPMTTSSSNEDLTISNDELKYYARRAKNFGVVITGTTFTIRKYQGFSHQFYAGDDNYLDSLKSLANTIKSNGALAILQVFLPGRSVPNSVASLPGIEVVSSSNVVSPREHFDTVPKILTSLEIEEIINSFYDTTKRAIAAGFDGVEIHGANTYLIQQFRSKATNLRDDEYGKDLLLFSKQIVDACLKAKNEANNEFIIGYRFSPEELETPGIRLNDTLELVENLCNTDVDYLHVSLAEYNQASYFDENVIIGKELIKAINGRKPLIGVGGIFTKAEINLALEFGYDYIAIGKSAIMNPDFINLSDEKIVRSVDINEADNLDITPYLKNVFK